MLHRARVVAVHPEDHSVDIVMVADGSRYVGVQVLAPVAATDAGIFDMPVPSPLADKWSQTQPREREVTAIVAMLGFQPVVLGFMYPQVNGMLFADLERRIMRHASDLYTSIDADANVEVAHPNGSYVRIGTAPDHEDLTGQDFDGHWKISKNTGRSTHLQVVIKAGGAQKAKLHIDPDGNVTLEHTGNLTVLTGGAASIEVAGNATVDVGGTTDVTSAGAAAVHAPSISLDAAATTCTGTLTVQGVLTFEAGMVGTGGAAIAGEVSADVIGLKAHRHLFGGSPTTAAIV